ncbi:hypothetical protein K501DRAFT_272609 [Backusella circina FSU 941]|nr:hypothetical protein K501DRAFT_272609 [Backusella circina FSU 941]
MSSTHSTSNQEDSSQPVSIFEEKRSEGLLKDGNSVSPDSKENQIGTAHPPPLTSITNSITNKDHAIFNQTLSVFNDEVICKQAPKKTHLLTTGDREAQPYDMLLLGMRNLIELISKTKAKETLHENKLSCASAHSVLNPLFSSPDSDRLLTWPLSLVVDVKGEDHKENAHDCLVDLIRICMISGDSINKHNFDGTVGLHVVGLQISFYIITLMPNGIFVLLEIGSVSSPIDFTETRSYIATMEDILLVIHYYDCCSTSLYVS